MKNVSGLSRFVSKNKPFVLNSPEILIQIGNQHGKRNPTKHSHQRRASGVVQNKGSSGALDDIF